MAAAFAKKLLKEPHIVCGFAAVLLPALPAIYKA